MRFRDSQFSRDREQLTAEASGLGLGPACVPQNFEIEFEGGAVREFEFVSTDRYGETVGGWNYSELAVWTGDQSLPLRVLIIND